MTRRKQMKGGGGSGGSVGGGSGIDASYVAILACIAMFVVCVLFLWRGGGGGGVKNDIHITEKTVAGGGAGGGVGGGWGWGGGGWIPNIPYFGSGWRGPWGDTLLNPYAPPLRDERYGVGWWGWGGGPVVGGWAGTGVGGAPVINVPTNIGAVQTEFRQVGMLTPLHKEGNAADAVLPLMGRPVYSNRDKWQYYALSDQRNGVKFPVVYKGRNGMNDNGVDKLYSRDKLFVEGSDREYNVRLYENESIQYVPF